MLRTIISTKKMCIPKKFGLDVKMMSHKRVSVVIITHGTETYGLSELGRLKSNFCGGNCLRRLCRLTRLERVRNEGVRFRIGVRKKHE